MERSEAIGFFEQSESFIKMYLKEIKCDGDPLVFSGTTAINNIFNVNGYVNEVANYIRDGKESAERLKSELIDLRGMVTELHQEANKKGFIGFAGVCDAIINRINALERFDPIPEKGEIRCVNTEDNSGESKKMESLTIDQIKAKINKIEPFLKTEASDNIPYGVYWTQLTKGEIRQADGVKKVLHVIDDEKCDLHLFSLCVERADISDIITDGNKMIARLFMYYVASKFEDSDRYRKAANKAFGLDEKKTRPSAIPYKYRAIFHRLLGKEFPDSEPK
jgi:hypothetical protein